MDFAWPNLFCPMSTVLRSNHVKDSSQVQTGKDKEERMKERKEKRVFKIHNPNFSFSHKPVLLDSGPYKLELMVLR